MNLQEVLNLARQLSSADKIQLIQQLSFDLQGTPREYPTAPAPQSVPQTQWDMFGGGGSRHTPDNDDSRWEDLAQFPD